MIFSAEAQMIYIKNLARTELLALQISHSISKQLYMDVKASAVTNLATEDQNIITSNKLRHPSQKPN